MRLPVVSQLSTKDGVSNKNSRLINMLKESRKTGDLAVVRPGLVLDAQASGVGNGLVAFNNELVSVYGSTLGFGVEPDSYPRVQIGALGTGVISAANAVSESGSVIVGQSRTTVSSSPVHAFVFNSSMSDIGAIGADTYSSATDVSDDGLVVVGNSGVSTVAAFRWTSGGGMSNLGAIPASYRTVFCSDDGAVVSGTKTGAGYRPFRWTSGDGFVDIGLGGIFSEAIARAMSKDGTTIVGEALDLPAYYYRAFFWDSTYGLTDLGGDSSGDHHALYVSGDGAVIVGYSDGLACFWTKAGAKTNLGYLSGGSSSTANAVSADGTTIVGSSVVSGQTRAFKWTPGGGMVDLGDPDYDFLHITATDVSDDGSVIVGVITRAGSIYRPFKWTEASGVVDVGSDDSFYSYVYGVKVSGDGTTVIGTEQEYNGSSESTPFYSSEVAANIPTLETITGDRYDFAQSPL